VLAAGRTCRRPRLSRQPQTDGETTERPETFEPVSSLFRCAGYPDTGGVGEGNDRLPGGFSRRSRPDCLIQVCDCIQCCGSDRAS
jgi:hypothetical protein